MKVSINLANSYSNVKLDSDGIEALAKKIGSQLGAIEDIEFWAKKYTKATVVRVVECVKHPNADKLSLCHVDDGGIHKEVERDERGFVQVVCAIELKARVRVRRHCEFRRTRRGHSGKGHADKFPQRNWLCPEADRRTRNPRRSSHDLIDQRGYVN